METPAGSKKNKRGRKKCIGSAVDHHHRQDDQDHVKKKKKTQKIIGAESSKLRCHDQRYSSNNNINKDGVGVFDFPWLKGSDEYYICDDDDEPSVGLIDHTRFGLFYNQDEDDNVDHSLKMKLPLFHHHHHEEEEEEEEEDKPGPTGNINKGAGCAGAGGDLQQQLDHGIWSSVLDQPLDINLNII